MITTRLGVLNIYINLNELFSNIRTIVILKVVYIHFSFFGGLGVKIKVIIIKCKKNVVSLLRTHFLTSNLPFLDNLFNKTSSLSTIIS